MKALVKAGANINQMGGYNTDTSLFRAVSSGFREVVVFLLEMGANPDIVR